MRSLTAYAILYLLYGLAAYLIGQALMAHMADIAWRLDMYLW